MSFREMSDFDCITTSHLEMSLDIDQSLMCPLDHHPGHHIKTFMGEPHEGTNSNLLAMRGKNGRTGEAIRSLSSEKTLLLKRRRMASHSTTPGTDYQPRFSIAIIISLMMMYILLEFVFESMIF